MFQHMAVEHLARDARSFRAAASATASWIQLLQLLVDAEVEDVQIDLTFGNMLSSSLRRVWQKALNVPQLLLCRRLEADPVTYSSLASGYQQHWKHSVMSLVGMSQRRVPSDAYNLAACLDALAKRLAWERSSAMLVSRPQAFCTDTACLAAIEGLSKASEWNLSAQQLEKLDWNGIQKNVFMYSAVAAGRFLSFSILALEILICTS